MGGAFAWQDDALLLRIHLQPRASRDEIVGLQGDRLKIRITAPPVDGKANRHLLHFLARRFRVPRHQVTLLSGQASRTKRVRIERPRRLPAPIRPADPA